MASSLSALAPEARLRGRWTPRGCIEVYVDDALDVAAGSSQVVAKRICKAFALGRAEGLLHLAARELAADLHPSLACWRELGKLYVAAVCAAVDPENPIPELGLEPGLVEDFVLGLPPMPGAERITVEAIELLWGELNPVMRAAAAGFADGVQGYLKKQDSVWHVVGRVCLHLAENKRDPDFPFAFLATYAHRPSSGGKVGHKPLAHALRELSAASQRKKRMALLSPLARAAGQSDFLKQLIDSGEAFTPLIWTAVEAHRFLRETEIYEQAGLVVRIPDWWDVRKKPRPQVTVSLGSDTPSSLGVDAMLSFDVRVTLDGRDLSPDELEAILAASEGLVLLKGKWVEVDTGKLRGVLDHWQEVASLAEQDGTSFGQGMRLLAGVDDGGPSAAQDHEEVQGWTRLEAGDWLASRLRDLRAPRLREDIEANAGLQAELRPYQKLGVQWLVTLRELGLGACLADDMGLGKTIQVLGLLQLRKSKSRAVDLLVVPASLLDNWRLEAERFAPGLRLLVAHPSQMKAQDLAGLTRAKLAKYDAVITTYGSVTRHPVLATQSWRHLILDEAQAIKNPGTKQTKAVKALESEWRLALTGTPVENRLGDLWSIFDFLNPGLLGSATDFRRLCKSMSQGASGYAPLRRLLQPYILRRLKTDKSVIADLPDKAELNAYCYLSKRQAALYSASVKAMAQDLKRLTGIERRGVVLAFLMRFKQICNHPSQWLGDGDYAEKDSGKFARLRELAESIAERQEKVLVFTQFREMTDPLCEQLSLVFGQRGLVLHGGTAVKKRQSLVQRFQADEDCPFMVLSLKAGGTGLNLTAASQVIHFDRWWNPAVENQATDRAFRIGQKKNVLVHKFVCRGTIEERIDEMLAQKQSLSDEVLSSGTAQALTEMSDTELISMVSLDLNAALGS